jgi:N utilization substance protein B
MAGPGSDRHAQRERALGLLYEAELKEVSVDELLADLPVPPEDFVIRLVKGVGDNSDAIDARILPLLRDWTIERLAVVDRAVLRLGAFELEHTHDVPTAVVLDEAVELAKAYGSTDESGSFVNGVLAALAAQVRPVS